MDSIKYSFGPELWQYKIEDEDFLNWITIEGKGSTINLSDKLVGKIMSEVGFTFDVNNKIDKIINPYIIDYFNKNKIGIEEVRAIPNSVWMNIQREGEWNPPHKHMGDITFVLYVDMPEEIKNEGGVRDGFQPGSITFFYNCSSSVERGNDIFSSMVMRTLAPKSIVSMVPNRGDLLIFPSYLIHYVEPFKSKVERISISGNYDLIRNKINIV